MNLSTATSELLRRVFVALCNGPRGQAAVDQHRRQPQQLCRAAGDEVGQPAGAEARGQLDLGATVLVDRVEVYHRTDGRLDDLQGASVVLAQSGGPTMDAEGQVCSQTSSFDPEP